MTQKWPIFDPFLTKNRLHSKIMKTEREVYKNDLKLAKMAKNDQKPRLWRLFDPKKDRRFWPKTPVTSDVFGQK